MKNNKWYTWVAYVFAIWFAFSSWCWLYELNLVFSYPFGLAAWILWFIGRKQNPENELNKKVKVILIRGLLISVVLLSLLIVWAIISFLQQS